MIERIVRIGVAALMTAVCWTAAPHAFSQAATGTIGGIVSDTTGGVLPGAMVTITEYASGRVLQATVTDGEGRYSVAVPAGSCVVRAELAGFTTFTSEAIKVGAGSAVPLDVTLKIQPYADTVVVTGSGAPEALRAAPVAMTVVREQEIENTPAAHYGELLRSVPGVNTIELSARDVQIATRTATGRNARTTLALLDGRTIYQDYFGMVLWDLLPVSFDQVKQVEVLRGPGSAIWGANALTGVINIITKSPKEMTGTQARIGVGTRGTFDGGLVHAGVNGRLGYKLSTSLYTQDRWDRPAARPDGTPLPPYESDGTTQVKVDVRADFDKTAKVAWRFDGGFATSGGLILVAAGPFDADPLRQGYGSVRYSNGSMSAAASVTAHHARYQGLLTTVGTSIDSQSMVLEAKDSRSVRERHLLVYGGSFKHSHFDLSFVPDITRREELGVFVADDMFVSERFRLTAGARMDWFDTFGVSVSPRAGLRFDPRPGHTLRATYNRAYVAPSLVENFAYFPSTFEIPLPAPFPVPVLTQGRADLRPQTIDAFEAGYTGTLAERVTLSASLYRNRTRGFITLLTTETYSPANPPPGWVLPPETLAALVLPKTFTFSSAGIVDEAGLEASVDVPVRAGILASANYSFQARPALTPRPGETAVAINIPARHRANISLSAAHRRLSGTLNASFTDRAFWVDVLAIEGWTERFWTLNGTFAIALPGDRVTWLVKGTNLGDRVVQHHIFGDLIRRRLATELRVRM